MTVLVFLNINTAFAEVPAVEFFEKHVRPILVKRCYECHGGVKTSGDLRLDTRAGWQAGGESGPAIIPGNPDESLLIDAINYRTLEMPPPNQGGKLSNAEIDVLTKWVNLGATDPRDDTVKLAGMSVQEANSWWAFQSLPVAEPNPSPIHIDNMLLAELRAQTITPNSASGKRTLLRRADLRSNRLASVEPGS